MNPRNCWLRKKNGTSDCKKKKEKKIQKWMWGIICWERRKHDEIMNNAEWMNASIMHHNVGRAWRAVRANVESWMGNQRPQPAEKHTFICLRAFLKKNFFFVFYRQSIQRHVWKILWTTIKFRLGSMTPLPFVIFHGYALIWWHTVDSYECSSNCSL